MTRQKGNLVEYILYSIQIFNAAKSNQSISDYLSFIDMKLYVYYYRHIALRVSLSREYVYCFGHIVQVVRLLRGVRLFGTIEHIHSSKIGL